MLDPKTLQRDEFIGGHLVRLADGQEWILPLPQLYWVPDDTEEGFAKEWNIEGYASFYDAALDEANADQFTGRMVKAIAFLLRRNYTLDTDQIKSLLRFNFGDSSSPEETEMRQSLFDLALGKLPAPKALADGLV